MLNKVACSYYNAAAIAENGDLYVWGSGSSGIFGSDTNTSNELPKKFPLEKISPDFKANHVSMGPNHMAILVTNRFLDKLNPKIFVQDIHKQILQKQRAWFKTKRFDLPRELQLEKHTYISKSDFIHFLDFVNPHIHYTREEENELADFVDFFSLHHQDRVNLAQYIYCLDPSYFASDIVYTVGLNDNGRLGTGKSDNTGPAESRNSMISDILQDESRLNQALALKKDRIQEITQVKIGVPVQKVSCGHKFTLALDTFGQIWAWGKGGDGCLGTGQLDDKWSPELVNFTHFGNTNEERGILDISAGAEHCLAINRSNEIFSWGKGNQGRLGHDNEVASLVPRKIAAFDLKQLKVTLISAGEQHSACITQNHELYTWGSGANYRLGHGTLHNSFKPERVQHISDHYVTRVSCGSTHTLCLTSDGHIFAMGSGLNGRLGIDVAGGHDYKTPTRIAPYSEDVKLKSFVEVAAGPHQSFGLTDEGELLAWGSTKFNTLGIIGLKTDLHIPTPIHLGNLKFHFKKKKKKTDADNKNQINFDSYDLAFQEKLDRSNPPFEIVRIFCGETNTVFLMANGDIYISGSGQHGQLCINPETKGEEFCGDKGSLKELFMEEEIVYSHIPIYIPINLEIKFKYVAIGLSHIIALTMEGKAYAWGKNTEGQLGMGSGSRYIYKPTLIEEVCIKKFAMCVASHTYSALLSENGEVWVCGSAEYGCLGMNSTKQNYDIPTPKMINSIPPMKYIAAAPQHMAAITTHGELYVWGNNNNGRLGIEGKNQKVWVPRKVTITNTHGHAVFKQVSCGFMHTLLLDTDGHIWGAGSKPYAGFPSDAGRALEEQNQFMLIPDLKKQTFIHISSGEFHNLAVSTNLQVFGWGKTDYGKLAQETLISMEGVESKIRNVLLPKRIEKLEQVAYVSAGVNHSTCVNVEGDAFVWGNVLMGRLGVSRDDIKLLKNLKKITNELNVLSLNMPHKLQAFFEEELTRKLKIFAKTSTKEAYDFNAQNNNLGSLTFTEYENSKGDESSEIEDAPGTRILKKKFTFAAADIQKATSTNYLDNRTEEGKDHSDNDNISERRSIKDSIQEGLEAEQRKSEVGSRFLGDGESRFTNRVLVSEFQVPTKTTIGKNNTKSVRSSNKSKAEVSHVVAQNKNTDRFLIENYATQFKQHQAGLNVEQLKLQKELYDDETEYYEPSLYNRDTDLDKGLKVALEKITKQIDSMKLNFAANMVETQSIVQTSLHLLESKTRTLKNFNPTVPSFILQNIQVYEGILSYLFNHPCYWYNMLKNRNMDHQMVLEWIYKMYRSDGEGRVVNLALSLALMLLEDEVGLAKPSSLEEVYVLTNYTKLYNFLIKSQECNRNFIREIVAYIIQDVIIQEYTDMILEEEQLIDEIDHNTRVSKGSKKTVEVSDSAQHYYNLDYHLAIKNENPRYGQFDKAIERCLSLVKKLENYLKGILSQPHFSVQGKISREVCYLNARIIEEYRHSFEKKAQSSEGAYSCLDAQITRTVREAELLVIDMFFNRISDYLVNYEIHGIQVPLEFKKLLSTENLKSIGRVITAYFQRKEFCNDPAYDKLNHYTQTISKKYDTVKMFIQGMTAHDDFDLTLDNILRVTEDSACFKDRYNSLFTVKDIIELQNSLAKLSKTPDFFIAGENDPIYVLLNYLEFGEYDLAKFPYQVLQNRVNMKINSKILHKNPEDEEIDIHRCNFCNLVYPKDLMGVKDMKLINQANWVCDHCKEDNSFENRFCYACGSVVPDYLYQQRSIFKKYLPLVKKDQIIYEYLDFIKSQPKIYENDQIVTILTDLIETALKEGNFEKSHQYSQVLHWIGGLTVHKLVDQYSLKLDESSNEIAINLLNQLLTYEYGLRKKHKVYLDKVENLLGKIQYSVNVAKRTCDELHKKFDIIEAKVMVSHGKYNGLANTALNAPSEEEEHKIKDKIAYSKVRPFGIFTSEELKSQKVLLSFVLHDKVVPKITTNLKFYFFYREDVGFQVKVVFLEDTWINYFVRFGPWFTNEVALDQFAISSDHLLELRRTAHYKAEITFGYSTFSVEKLANLLDSILVKNYYHKVTTETTVKKDKSKDQKDHNHNKKTKKR